MIEDESEEPSRVGTPAITDEKIATMAENIEGSEKRGEKGTDAAPELPVEVRTKLRKLEKLESKYQGGIWRVLNN